MRKFDRELQLRRWISKSKSRLITRRGLRMTNRANYRPRALKKLGPVTTHAGGMIRIILDIGECGRFGPILCGHFMTGIACALMLLGGVREL